MSRSCKYEAFSGPETKTVFRPSCATQGLKILTALGSHPPRGETNTFFSARAPRAAPRGHSDPAQHFRSSSLPFFFILIYIWCRAARGSPPTPTSPQKKTSIFVLFPVCCVLCTVCGTQCACDVDRKPFKFPPLLCKILDFDGLSIRMVKKTLEFKNLWAGGRW